MTGCGLLASAPQSGEAGVTVAVDTTGCVLVTFEVVVIKCPDESNLREKGFTLADS